jgi:two-component system chemotaxis sensor kinase CheA
MAIDHKGLKILCVDDDQELLALIGTYLVSIDFTPVTATSVEEALKKLESMAWETALIISDLVMPSGSGLDLRNACLEKYRDIPFVVLSGHVSRELALQGIELKIAAFIDKPPRIEALLEIIKKQSQPRVEQIREKQILEKTFVGEASQILEELEPLIMSLERTPQDQNVINTIFRLIHTIKGSSGVLDSDIIMRFAHRFEDMLAVFKRGDRLIVPEDVTIMLKAYDILKNLIAAVESRQLESFKLSNILTLFVEGEAKPATAHPSQSLPRADTPHDDHAHARQAAARDNLRVSMQTLDEFMEFSGEITVIRNMVNKLVKSIEKSQPGNRDVGLLIDLLDEMHKINGSMQEKIVEMRKVPLGNVFKPLPRTIRDLSHSLGKDIDFSTTGEDLRIDTTISQALSESLIHLVRNSADHGIEKPDVRRSAGKTTRGRIHVRGIEERDEILIEIEDNGRGIDPEKIRSKLVENGTMSREEAARIPDQKVLYRIFDSGFSTAAAISDVSGRGVGMDMVRASIERLQGRIEIQTNKGTGTKFTLHLPIPKSVTILNSLLTSIANQTFAIPQDGVQRLLRLETLEQRAQIRKLTGGMALAYEGEHIPLIRLHDVLGLPCAVRLDDLNQELSIVVVKTKELKYALLVDTIMDSEEIVVKMLGKHLASLQVYAGATFLGDGTVGLILDLEGIARRLHVFRDDTAPRDEDEEPREVSASLDRREYLICHLMGQKGLYGFPSEQIFRIEEFDPGLLQYSGQKQVMIYRGALMQLINLPSSLKIGSSVHFEKGQHILVYEKHERYFGFITGQAHDIIWGPSTIDTSFKTQEGIAGCFFMGHEVVTLVDLEHILLSAGYILPEPAQEETTGLAVEATNPRSDVRQPEATVAGWGLFD